MTLPTGVWSAPLTLALSVGLLGSANAEFFSPNSPKDFRKRTDYGAPPENLEEMLDHLVASYPDHLASHNGQTLFWLDGTEMPVSDGRIDKDFQTLLNDPDLDDMFTFRYVAGDSLAGRSPNDPGRVRYEPFFNKIYGHCKNDEQSLLQFDWPTGGRLHVTTTNGINEKLARVAQRIHDLPQSALKFVAPTSGGYNCRVIAGTQRLSVHSYGAAFDGNAKRAAYWRWVDADRRHQIDPSQFMPQQVVEAFEAEGFIWGGKWFHFDTMHFEYRPELIFPKAE